MKVFQLALIKTLFHVSTALKCGISGVTKPCIGDTDVRYDTSVGYNIKEENEFWGKLEGLYIDEQCDYDKDGKPITMNTLSYEGIGSWNFCNMKGFSNVTIDGSRIIRNRYLIVPHNGDGPGGMQVPGFVFPTSSYSTSTFEKNGEAYGLALLAGYNNSEFSVDENPSINTPVGEKALLKLSSQLGGDFYASDYCPDSKCEIKNTYIENYGIFGEGNKTSPKVVSFSRISSRKAETKEEWLKEWSNVFTEFKVPSSDEPFPGFNYSNFVQPFDPNSSESAPECATLICPSEDDWATSDPKLRSSPYVEPDGVLTGGFIAGITIASIVLACIIFYVIYKRGVDAREKRVKEAVLKSIAKNMTISSSKTLTPHELQDMFNKIDVDGNGNLNKSEVKGLVDEAGVANMSDSDYNILFASIDIDENGTLDFAEFCSFFTSISSSDGFSDNA